VVTGGTIGVNLWEGLGETELGRSHGFLFGDDKMLELERARMGLPADAPLTNGTASLSVIAKTAGSRTVTASNLTHTAITANTSAATRENARIITLGVIGFLFCLAPNIARAASAPRQLPEK